MVSDHDRRELYSSEMTTLGARIDARLPKLMWANAASMVGVAGLVLAAAKPA